MFGLRSSKLSLRVQVLFYFVSFFFFFFSFFKMHAMVYQVKFGAPCTIPLAPSSFPLSPPLSPFTYAPSLHVRPSKIWVNWEAVRLVGPYEYFGGSVGKGEGGLRVGGDEFG